MHGSPATRSSNDDPTTREPHRLLSPAIDLVHAWCLVARVLVPIGILSALGLMILHLLYLRNPARTEVMHSSVEHLIVMEQVKRSATLPAAEIVFLGDSSCLMGIDALAVERALDLHPVESFCSLGWVGPAGYGQMLAGLIDRNTPPKVLVLMFHPIAFRREPNWDYWSALVDNWERPKKPALGFPRSALDFLAFEWLTRLIYSPLPGAYALYYGSEGSFRSMIRARHGSAVDPSTGLNVSSLRDLRAVPTPPTGKPADFNWNQPYQDSLRTLAEAIKKLGPQTRTYLVVSPVPDWSFPPGTEGKRIQREEQIAAALGITRENILATPDKMFGAYFSGYTHLNRWGQSVFTKALIKAIASKR